MLTETQIKAQAPTPAGVTCQSCGSGEVVIFHEAGPVPVNSCILFNDAETARAYPSGKLSLGFCRQCGFVGNTAFDPAMARYTSSYEEQQSFSPRFNAFATSLAQRIIDRYDVRNKTVLEIGCGKGDFLMLMCELGSNRGIGIDPSYIPERQEGKLPGQVEFIADFYSEEYTHLKADVVLCRHTLEHISDTAEFMRMVRRAIGDQTDTLVVFELPDVMRVLKEAAFWDIYYEHCSYFTLGSLARLFRHTGFEVLHLEKDFDDQYLLIEARPAKGTPTGQSLAEENDLEETAQAVAQYQEALSRVSSHWKARLDAARAKGQKVAIWGSGSKCVAFLSTLGLTSDVDAIVDINTHRHGRFLPRTGLLISSPEALKEVKPDLVIAMNPIYLAEIGNDLAQMGLNPELVAV